MKNFKDILNGVETISIKGDAHININSIKYDSREVRKNDVFVAIKGTYADGHKFIGQAVKNGASVIVVSDNIDLEAVTVVRVKDTSVALAEMVANYFGNPDKDLKIIALIGTNGKTTTATSLYRLFNSLGEKAGLISTVKNYICEDAEPARLTTPDAVALFGLLRKMADAGCKYVFMEVTSHAIVQKRVYGIDFYAGIFTNITQDHLDFHKTFKNYLYAKKSFFDNLAKDTVALINIDDKNGKVMVQNTKAKVYTYALKQPADFKGKIIEKHFDSTLVQFNGKELWLQFVGSFNVYNLLAVYGFAMILMPGREDEILTALSELKPVEGRFEVVKGKGITGLVDFAHTPDALEKTLKELNDIRRQGQRIITVVGAGGDRDKTKRPLMAQISMQLSDFLILTSDNPRSENPEDILDDMEKGIKGDDFLRITDRRQAIKTAVKMANEGDIVFVAGKGHEKYQEINGVKHHFDDKEELEKLLKQ